MIDFDNETLLEGLSLSGSASMRVKTPSRPKPPKAPKRGLGASLMGAIKLPRKAANMKRAAAQVLAAKAALHVPKVPPLTAAAVAKLAAPLAKVTVTPAVAELVGTKLAMQGHPAAHVRAVLAAGISTPAEAKAVKLAMPSIAANVKEAALMSAARVAAIAKVPTKKRIDAAAHVLAKAATTLAAKGATPKPEHPEATKRKACAVAAPVAHACGCQVKHHPHILRKARVKLASAGYPSGTLDGMLANLHDMQDSLEKASLQRLATYEHNSIVSRRGFETEVLRRLANLACKLPKCSPTRVKAFSKIRGAL